MDPSECAVEKQETTMGDFDLSLAKNLLSVLNVASRRRFTSEGGAPSTPCIPTPVARRSSALSTSDDVDLSGSHSAHDVIKTVFLEDEVRLSL
jgi:hypothetical protein